MTEDEQEALSLKYAKSLSILALSSGKFALFLPFSNETGIPLARIDDWAGLEAEVRAWRDKEEPEVVTKRKADDVINLAELFGDERKENLCGN
jgi:hypothetical protein